MSGWRDTILESEAAERGLAPRMAKRGALLAETKVSLTLSRTRRLGRSNMFASWDEMLVKSEWQLSAASNVNTYKEDGAVSR